MLWKLKTIISTTILIGFIVYCPAAVTCFSSPRRITVCVKLQATLHWWSFTTRYLSFLANGSAADTLARLSTKRNRRKRKEKEKVVKHSLKRFAHKGKCSTLLYRLLLWVPKIFSCSGTPYFFFHGKPVLLHNSLSMKTFSKILTYVIFYIRFMRLLRNCNELTKFNLSFIKIKITS